MIIYTLPHLLSRSFNQINMPDTLAVANFARCHNGMPEQVVENYLSHPQAIESSPDSFLRYLHACEDEVWKVTAAEKAACLCPAGSRAQAVILHMANHSQISAAEHYMAAISLLPDLPHHQQHLAARASQKLNQLPSPALQADIISHVLTTAPHLPTSIQDHLSERLYRFVDRTNIPCPLRLRYLQQIAQQASEQSPHRHIAQSRLDRGDVGVATPDDHTYAQSIALQYELAQRPLQHRSEQDCRTLLLHIREITQSELRNILRLGALGIIPKQHKLLRQQLAQLVRDQNVLHTPFSLRLEYFSRLIPLIPDLPDTKLSIGNEFLRLINLDGHSLHNMRPPPQSGLRRFLAVLRNE
jgi:hypothetical protein